MTIDKLQGLRPKISTVDEWLSGDIREDVVGAIELLLQAPKGGHIYNICAPSHPARSAFYPLMARQLGLAAPVFGEAKDDSKGKIVDGNRICHELGFEYQYPDPLVMPME